MNTENDETDAWTMRSAVSCERVAESLTDAVPQRHEVGHIIERRIMVLLRDIVDRDVISLTPDMSIADARRLLARRRAGIAPVLSHGRVLGVIAAHELLLPMDDHLEMPLTRARGQCLRGPAAWFLDGGGMLSVGDLPLHNGHLFPLDTDLGRAAHYVWRTGTEYLLLLQQGRLAGIVSATRIIAAVSRSEFRRRCQVNADCASGDRPAS